MNTLKILCRASIIFIAVFMMAGIQAVRADVTATRLLERVASKINTAPSVSVKFTISGAEGPVNGTMTIAKERFVMNTPDMSVWFNGNTQWTYLKSSSEVSITEPTSSELMESNPFVIINHYRDSYTCRKLSSNGNRQRVELTPRKGVYSSIKSAVITIDTTTDSPTDVSVSFSEGSAISVSVTSMTVGKGVPLTTFDYDPKKYPAKEIIDLR